ncbi:MAG: hypothetical protein ABW190_05085, partial [Rhizobacter sp.]
MTMQSPGTPEKPTTLGELRAGSGTVVDPAIRTQLDNQASAERVADIYGYLPITTVAMVVGVAVTVSQYWPLVPRIGMVAWLLALAALGGVRAWMYSGFKRRVSD